MSFDAILVDAGTGNLHSVENALRSLGANLLVTSDPQDVLKPGRVILPGVGAFGSFMDGLNRSGLAQAVCEVFQRGDPLFGICVGMQALFDVGEELGTYPGLGLIAGKVARFPQFPDLKVPHTGWNQLEYPRASLLFDGLEPGAYAYFNHSYYCAPEDMQEAIAETDYGLRFCSAIQRGNLFGVQFHPEKSQRVGRKILENFLKKT
jgi:imidazole glycerol-phosphate synthase subunit HisH